MEFRYWRVIVRYGHVGRKNEVSVARNIVSEYQMGILDVMQLVLQMPGVKVNGVGSIKQISREEYIEGRREEDNNLFLKALKSFKPKVKSSAA